MHKIMQLNLLDGSTVICKITYNRLNNTLIKTYYSQIINKINHQETI